MWVKIYYDTQPIYHPVLQQKTTSFQCLLSMQTDVDMINPCETAMWGNDHDNQPSSNLFSCLLFQNESQWQTEVHTEKWHTCLITLATVYSKYQ
jgi:hypothetical protein